LLRLVVVECVRVEVWLSINREVPKLGVESVVDLRKIGALTFAHWPTRFAAAGACGAVKDGAGAPPPVYC